jgi:aryl-alcohol dehydrogenase-like predicted oxidoreductase
MGMRFLPSTDILVSQLCLGTMMFGDQVNEKQAFAQLDAATKKFGINFIDTAEIYPSPAAESSCGDSELIIGKWLQKSQTKRSDVVISTKICGFSNEITWCSRDRSDLGPDDFQGTELSEKQIFAAVDAQLKRLGTDYIDLLQFNWPQRNVPMYGAADYDAAFEREEREETSMLAQLRAIDKLVKAGKIRAFGLSNETPFGVSAFTHLAKQEGLTRPVTVQNPYSLLERNDFDSGMREACAPMHCNVGLLAHSPLAAGALTGKYYPDVRSSDIENRMRR